MVTENHVTPGKDSNYVNYQRFMSGVFPGAYIRVGGWGTNLTTGTHQWYARALIVYASNIFRNKILWQHGFRRILKLLERLSSGAGRKTRVYSC